MRYTTPAITNERSTGANSKLKSIHSLSTPSNLKLFAPLNPTSQSSFVLILLQGKQPLRNMPLLYLSKKIAESSTHPLSRLFRTKSIES